jgi:CheY-like chemotaxis protein
MGINLKALNVILADDDADDRFFFREIISELDIKINLTEFEDGDHLMDYLVDLPREQLPHLVFLDINMPRKTGIECLREIRADQKFCNVPIIMFTTSINKRDIEDSYKCGANMFIRKAYSFQEGLQTMKKLLEDYSSKSLMNIPRDEYFIG